jgi:hypothetical protein
MTKTTKTIAALTTCVVLAGCFDIPDYRGGARFSNPFSSDAPRTSAAPGDPLGSPPPAASAAETACLEAGRAAGFEVQGVVGTREVIGAGGLPQSRDVMLQVQRGGQSIEVRCSYAYLDATAQIMTL